MANVKKIAVIGAGNVGATTFQRIVDRELANEAVITDVVEGLPQGKALDILESTPISGIDIHAYGSNDISEIKNSDIVIVTAGLARKPGMTRMDLLSKNAEIIQSVSRAIRTHAPNSIVIMVSNPLDVTTYIAYKVTQFKPSHIMGMAGVLDSARFKTFIAEELKTSKKDIHTFLLGGHGDMMVPIISHTNVAGRPLTELLSRDAIDKIVARTRSGGGEIVNLIKSGSAYYAPSLSIIEMVESIVYDKKRILPCSVHLNGEYGAKGVFIGVPAKLGKDGVEGVIELKLPVEEADALQRSITEIRKEISECPETFLSP
ncbi:MAG: malate dehydrogenase [Candidatus Thermoplasmatota archaeon]|nr:malate dehydrogenase [Candidatus Thermoplasmatota archaeon]MCL5963289.1 malate dehydrogenase [Candidatus Thermoplasmatota archaeon]